MAKNEGKQKMLTKTVRFGLLYKDDNELSYKALCSALWICQDEMRHALNAMSNEYKRHVERMAEIHNKTGNWPTGAETKEWYGCSFQTQLYRVACKYTKVIGSGCVAAAVNSEYGKWNGDMANFLRGDKAYPSFGKNQPISVPAQNTKLSEEGKDMVVSLALFSNVGKKELSLPSGTVWFKVYCTDAGSEAILRRCISGEYKPGKCAIKYDKRKKMWTCLMAFSLPKTEEVAGDKVLGMDLGLINVAYCVVAGENTRMIIPGGEVESFRARLGARLRDIQKGRPFCGDGSIGHGTDCRLKAITNVRESAARFRNTCNHKYSRAIVDFAKKSGCGTIQMEDLKGISEKHKCLKNWTYYDLQQKIRYKAAEVGIKVVTVDPRYTTQRCSRCWYIDADNVPYIPEFVCKSCGKKMHFDHNAARNLALVGIEDIISANLEQTSK